MEKNTVIGIVLAVLVFIAILQFMQLGNLKEAVGIGSNEDDANMQMLKEMHPEEYVRIKAQQASGAGASGSAGSGMVGGC